LCYWETRTSGVVGIPANPLLDGNSLTEAVIYVIQEDVEGGLLKIGCAVDPRTRLAQLQTGNPRLLKIIKALPGTQERERVLHRDLHEYRVQNEWFRPDPEVFQYLSGLEYVDYEVLNGTPYLVLWRIKESGTTEHCPFCGARHSHGTGDGHRVPHCHGNVTDVIAPDGTVLKATRGYIIRTKKFG